MRRSCGLRMAPAGPRQRSAAERWFHPATDPANSCPDVAGACALQLRHAHPAHHGFHDLEAAERQKAEGRDRE